MVVSTSAIDCLERLVSEMTYLGYVSSGTLNLHTHSLQHHSAVVTNGAAKRRVSVHRAPAVLAPVLEQLRGVPLIANYHPYCRLRRHIDLGETGTGELDSVKKRIH